MYLQTGVIKNAVHSASNVRCIKYFNESISLCEKVITEHSHKFNSTPLEDTHKLQNIFAPMYIYIYTYRTLYYN